MLPLEHPDRIQIAFTDHRLVANAGLLLVDLGDAPGRANTGDKILTLVASALAGGDCIDDAAVLRTGGTTGAIGCAVKAPSTLGPSSDRRGFRNPVSWLRASRGNNFNVSGRHGVAVGCGKPGFPQLTGHRGRDLLAPSVLLAYVFPMMRWGWLLLLAVVPALFSACGSAAEHPADFEEATMDSVPASVEMEAMPAQPAAPVPAPTAALQAASASVETDILLGDHGGPVPSMEQVQASVSSQNRIIVRTVHMSLVASDVAQAVDQVALVAQEIGGWVVGTDRSSRHRGFVSVRVPAQRLDDAVMRLRGLAVEVVSESSTSEDVTDEYVDSQSLLKTLQATEASMLQLIRRAATVEEALDVQRELVEIQAKIEVLLGRIKFLEQTSAFSLINVDLRLAPVDMSVDAGPDRTFSAGQVARFRAHFTPPEDMEDFTFTWDFGDGSQPITGTGTAPTTEPGQRVTATVNHVYGDDLDSPYIVQLEITGTGTGGLVEGSDTLIATVTEVPSLSVFAGESRTVERDRRRSMPVPSPVPKACGTCSTAGASATGRRW